MSISDPPIYVKPALQLTALQWILQGLILIRQLLNFSYFKSLDCNISYGSTLKLLVEKAEVDNFS